MAACAHSTPAPGARLQQHRAQLRRIMLLAWDLYRAELDGPDPRTFADALTGAWRWVKASEARQAGVAAWTSQVRARGGRLSPSLISSPIQRSLTGQPYAETRDHHAAYVTACLGG